MPFDEAFGKVAKLLRGLGGVEGLLVDESNPKGSLGDRPLSEFYGRGSVRLGFDRISRDSVLAYDTRPGGGGLARDYAIAGLLDALEWAREDGLDEAEQTRARAAQTFWAYQLASEVVCGRGLGSIVGDVAAGDDDALLILVRLDKTAVTTRLIRARIVEAQRAGDWEFFKRLGESMATRPLGEDPYLFDVEILASVFWDWRLKDLSYAKITKQFVEHGIVPPMTDPQSVRKTLNRLGFKKVHEK